MTTEDEKPAAKKRKVCPILNRGDQTLMRLVRSNKKTKKESDAEEEKPSKVSSRLCHLKSSLIGGILQPASKRSSRTVR